MITFIDSTEGSLLNPIPIYTNQSYEEGYYYIEDGIIYLCTISPTKDNPPRKPSQLVGINFSLIVE